MSKLPGKAVGRALADEDGLDDDALDRMVGGAGGPTRKQDAEDGWSRIVDDHAKEIPAAGPAKPRRTVENPNDG